MTFLISSSTGRNEHFNNSAQMHWTSQPSSKDSILARAYWGALSLHCFMVFFLRVVIMTFVHLLGIESGTSLVRHLCARKVHIKSRKQENAAFMKWGFILGKRVGDLFLIFLPPDILPPFCVAAHIALWPTLGWIQNWSFLHKPMNGDEGVNPGLFC